MCALQYSHEATKQQCLVKAILMEDQLLVNAMVGWDVISFTVQVHLVSQEVLNLTNRLEAIQLKCTRLPWRCPSTLEMEVM